MESIIFNYRSMFKPNIFDKLIEIIRNGDTKTKELHEVYKMDHNQTKFIAELSEYTRNKIERKCF